MSIILTPEEKTVGQANFQRVLGITRREFIQGTLAAGAVLPLGAAAYFGYNGNFGNRPVRAGLIGAGDEGGVLVGEHNPRFLEFIAYSDIRPTNQRRIFEGQPNTPRKGFNYHYGSNARKSIRLYEDYKELLANRDIEMVVIALPLNLHAQVAKDAMEAGKHVLCEKLMAWNVKQCKEMIRTAESRNMVLAVGHQRHYSMLYAHASEIMKSNVLGDVRHIRALWHRNNVQPRLDANGRPRTERIGNREIPMYRDSWRPEIAADDFNHLKDIVTRYGWKNVNELVRWRLYRETGGGLMAELGSHQLDACSIFLGKRRDHPVHPLCVTAVGGKNIYQDDREIEDHVYCTYEFPGKDYDRRNPPAPRDSLGNANYNDIVTVTYSSINTNGFEPYGECVMGSKGTLVVEMEQNAYLFGQANRTTAVSVGAAGGAPVLTASASTPGGPDQRAQELGQAALGAGPPSRGYREEMEHFAYILRNRNQGMARDEENLKPHCDGRAAMDDAIMALVANIAMRDRKRIEFRSEWFDPAKDDVPEEDHPGTRQS